MVDQQTKTNLPYTIAANIIPKQGDIERKR